MRIRILAMVLLLLGWGVRAQANTIWDAAADYSITNGNPNGAWSYGLELIGQPLVPFLTGKDWTERGLPDLQAWQDVQGYNPAYDPTILYNSGTTDISAFGYTWPAKTVTINNYDDVGAVGDPPGVGFPTVVWTAPADGIYDIAARYKDLNNTPTYHTFVAYAVSEVFDGGYIGLGDVTPDWISYSNTGVAMTAGQSFSFVFGATGIYGLDFTVTQVPEPSTLALLGFGLAGLSVFAWRKRK